MNRKRLAGALVLVAALGTGGFLAGRFLLGDGGTTAQQPNVVDQLSAIQTQEARQQAEPRFNGTLLGIQLAPSIDQLPPEAQDQQRRLTSCTAISVAEASRFEFPRALTMPSGFTLKDGYPQATACNGQATGLEWQYTATGAQGIPADVSIIRVITKYDTADVPASRVTTQVINGRGAIIIKPGTVDGLAQTSDVLFPEPFGKTSIHAFNLPQSELLKVADAVAEASR